MYESTNKKFKEALNIEPDKIYIFEKILQFRSCNKILLIFYDKKHWFSINALSFDFDRNVITPSNYKSVRQLYRHFYFYHLAKSIGYNKFLTLTNYVNYHIFKQKLLDASNLDLSLLMS